MTAVIIEAERLEARRREREERRREQEALRGSILAGGLDDEDDQPRAPASPAERKDLPR